jgi:hypothetical protein
MSDKKDADYIMEYVMALVSNLKRATMFMVDESEKKRIEDFLDSGYAGLRGGKEVPAPTQEPPKGGLS